MNNDNLDKNEDLFDELLRISERIDVENEIAAIAERSMIELKSDDFMPIFDEYYGARVVDQFVFDEKALKKPLRDPKGGLTAAGRAYFKRKEGANLKPGVRGPANTPEKMRRKGSFLTRFFTNPSGPMKDDKGRATRLALSAAAWGEPVPQNAEDAAKLAAKGRRLLERYAKTKKKSELIDDIHVKSLFGVDKYGDPLEHADMKGIGTMSNFTGGDDFISDTAFTRRKTTRNELLMKSIRAKTKSRNFATKAIGDFDNFIPVSAKKRRGRLADRSQVGKKFNRTR